MNTKIFLAAIILLLSIQSQGQRLPPDSTASRAIASLRKSINPANFKLFGLSSVEEAARLRLGSSPIEVYMIRLDSLKNFQDGDGRTTLISNNQVVYPLYSGDNLVSSVKLDFDGKSWSVESFGDRTLITNYQRALANTPQSGKKYIIRIPALNVYFSAVENNGIQVTLLGDEQMGDLKPGTTTTLQDALLKLKPLANAYNGLPW